MIETYAERFEDDMVQIPPGSAAARLHHYAELFDATSSQGLMCACGILAAEWSLAGEKSRAHVERYFELQAAWLRSEIVAGVDSGDFAAETDADAMAMTLLASLEGAVLMARIGLEAQPSEILDRIVHTFSTS